MSRDVCWQIERLVDALIFQSNAINATSHVDPSNSEMALTEKPFQVVIILMDTEDFKEANNDGLNIPLRGNLELFGNVCRYSGYESNILDRVKLAKIRNCNPNAQLTIHYCGKNDKNKIFSLTYADFFIKFIKRVG